MKDIHYTSKLGQIIVSFRNRPKEQKKREFEKNEILRLLIELNIPNESLLYGANGNPMLSESNRYISISHSEGWFAVYHGMEKIGIDIQVFHERIALGKAYFLNEKESKWESLLELHFVWATKEAIYKKYSGLIHDLAKEVTIVQINVEEKQILADYKNKIEILEFHLNENNVLVYTVN